MPKISLRAYNREISNLIDRGQTDEAVAHCQYILQTYPKHLESYRLLGKSYLEAHRYSEAVDIFQRVLAVVPDDFITHVGMSIIRNDENNLDAAIWHMERAFEVAPSNQAIQDELKHLYGRRDGQEPAKIRLTRGALCRMYVRGNQTRQAIAEIKSILAETPDRIDIEVLLARMYHLSNMTNEAVDLSRKILEKIPFCFDTNKLMIEILTSAKKSKDIDPYKQKLVALDPYEGLITDPSNSVDQVPDDAITVDRLYYDPATQPTRSAQTEGKPVSGDQEESAPDWLISDLTGSDSLAAQGFTRILDSSVVASESEEAEASATQPVVTEPLEEEPLPAWLKDAEQQAPKTTPEVAIPDFLKATGWAEAGTISEETPPSESYAMDETPVEGEIAPGNIPDWLQTLAPQDGVSEPETKKDDFSDWLSKLDQSPETLQQTGILSDEKIEAPDATPSVPDWLDQPKTVETTPEPAVSAEPASDLPNWLSDIGKNLSSTAPLQPASLEEKPVEPKPAERPAIPQPKATGSLKFAVDDNFPMIGGTSILSPDDVPDWLQDLEPSSTPSTTSSADVFSTTSSLSPVEPAHAGVPQESITTKLTPEAKEEIPEWLKDIQGTIQSEAEAVVPPPIVEIPQEVSTMKLTPEEKMEMPAWLTEIQSEPTSEESVPAEESVTDERKTATLPEEERDEVEQMPEWLHLLEQDGPEVATEPVAEVTPAQEVEPAIPAPFDFSTFTDSSETEKAPAEELPDFLSTASFMDTVLPAVEPVTEEPVAEVSPAPEEAAPILTPEPEQSLVEEFIAPVMEESAPVFSEELSQLFASVPEEAIPEEVIPEVDYRNPNLADFISPEMEESLDEDKPTTSILPPHPEDAAEELPEWLREIDSTVAEGTSPVELAEAEDTSEFPDWLKSYPTPASVETPLAAIEPEIEAEAEPMDEVPNWLQDMGTLQASEPTDLNLPDWLNDIQAAIEPATSDVTDQPVAALPEWLLDEVPAVEPVEEIKLEQFEELPMPEVEQPESILEETVSDAVDETAIPVVELPVMEEAQLVIEEPVLETSEIMEEEIEEPFEPATEEIVAPVAEASSWIPEETEPEEILAEIEHTDWEMRVDKGTQALSLEEPTEADTFAVPPDSILSDVSAAAAAAAIGIPLFAQSAGGTENLHNAEDFVSDKTVVEEPETESIPASEEIESVDELVSDSIDEAMVSESVDEAMVSEAIDEAMVSEAIDEVMVSEAIDEAMVSEVVDETIVSDAIDESIVVEEVPERVESIYTESEAEAEILEEVVPVESELEAVPVVPEESIVEEPVSEEMPEDAPVFEVSSEIPEVSEVEEKLQPEPVLEAEPVPVMEAVAPTFVETTPQAELDYQAIFNQASESLGTGDLEATSSALSSIVQSEKMLPEVIQLVKGAIDQNPSEFSLWMVLGDAYGRSGELQKALDAYIKAEEYLH